MFLTNKESFTKIGIVGTGYISRGLLQILQKFEDIKVVCVLTRRNINYCSDYPQKDLLTNSLEELVNKCELLIECSGDPIYATEVIDKVLKNNIPVVTINSEFQVTTGSYFVSKGVITEAEGDQPGCLAVMKEEAIQMGFKPLAYINVKSFLKYNPTLEEMTFWSKKNGISLQQVISFTDGTKLQIEQTLVANGLGAQIAADGLLGVNAKTIEEGARILSEKAEEMSTAISDFLLISGASVHMFILATHDEVQRPALQHYKLGDGPYYIIPRHYHLCYLEVPKTLKRIIDNGKILLNNGCSPKISVAAIAKKPFNKGDKIERGIGGFDVRGTAVNIDRHNKHVPIGLMSNAIVKRKIEEGHMLTYDDVDLPDSLAVQIWHKMR